MTSKLTPLELVNLIEWAIDEGVLMQEDEVFILSSDDVGVIRYSLAKLRELAPKPKPRPKIGAVKEAADV